MFRNEHKENMQMSIQVLTAVFTVCIIVLGLIVVRSNQVYECTQYQQAAIMDYAESCSDDEFNKCFNKAIKEICKKRM